MTKRQVHRPSQPRRGLDLPGISAEAPQHQVGEHDRNADRHQRLAKVLPLHPPEYGDLEDDAKERGDDESGDEADQPGTAGLDRQIAEIAAQQVDRAMREIDVSHQAENEGEPACNEEIKTTERDPVEGGVEEELLPAEHRLEARRPWGEHEPDRGNHQNDDDERPDRTARDEAVHQLLSWGSRRTRRRVGPLVSLGGALGNTQVAGAGG